MGVLFVGQWVNLKGYIEELQGCDLFYMDVCIPEVKKSRMPLVQCIRLVILTCNLKKSHSF